MSNGKSDTSDTEQLQMYEVVCDETNNSSETISYSELFCSISVVELAHNPRLINDLRKAFAARRRKKLYIGAHRDKHYKHRVITSTPLDQCLAMLKEYGIRRGRDFRFVGGENSYFFFRHKDQASYFKLWADPAV